MVKKKKKIECLMHFFNGLKPFSHYYLSNETGLRHISWIVSKSITNIGETFFVLYIDCGCKNKFCIE